MFRLILEKFPRGSNFAFSLVAKAAQYSSAGGEKAHFETLIEAFTLSSG